MPDRLSGRRRPPRRESRKVREARKRREAFRRTLLLLGLVPLLVVAGAVVVVVVVVSITQHGQATVIQRPAPTIAGIPCQSEQANYHEHAHLGMVDAGRSLPLPGNVGHAASGCLYWLHTHASDPQGIIHIEAPRRIVPTLGAFFDIWGKPLSRQRAGNAVVRPGQSMRVYLGQRLYRGNPRGIRLHPHTTVTIEVGPPFALPRKYRFEQGY